MGGFGPRAIGICQRCRKLQGYFHSDVFPEGYYCDPCKKIVASPNRKSVVQAFHKRVAARRAKEALTIEVSATAHPHTEQDA